MEFKTADFANDLEQDLTPIGLGWFQTQWDESVSQSAKALGMLEASFEQDLIEGTLSWLAVISRSFYKTPALSMMTKTKPWCSWIIFGFEANGSQIV